MSEDTPTAAFYNLLCTDRDPGTEQPGAPSGVSRLCKAVSGSRTPPPPAPGPGPGRSQPGLCSLLLTSLLSLSDILLAAATPTLEELLQG